MSQGHLEFNPVGEPGKQYRGSTSERSTPTPGVSKPGIYASAPENHRLKAAWGWDDSAWAFLICVLEVQWSSQVLDRGHRHRDTDTGVRSWLLPTVVMRSKKYRRQDTDGIHHGSFLSKFKAIFALLYQVYREGKRKFLPAFGGCDPILVGQTAELGGAAMVLGGRAVCT